MKKGAKTSMADIIECVGPRCISVLRKKSKRMSISGSTDRTKIKGKLNFALRMPADALPSRYAIPMCPMANKSGSSLEMNQHSG